MAKTSRRRVITATAAAKNFGALIDRVRTERAEYVVERGGAPAVRVSPADTRGCSVAEFVEFLASHARADAAYLKAVESGIAALNKPSVPEDRWAR